MISTLTAHGILDGAGRQLHGGMTQRSKSDIPILFTTRIVRLFAYGGGALILALYLAKVRLHEANDHHFPTLRRVQGTCEAVDAIIIRIE